MKIITIYKENFVYKFGKRFEEIIVSKMKEESGLKFWQIWKVNSKVQSINCSIEMQTKQKFFRGRNILQSITRWFQYIYKKLQSSIVIFKCK